MPILRQLQESVAEGLDNVLTVFRAFRRLEESIGGDLYSKITVFWKLIESVGRDLYNKIRPKIAAVGQSVEAITKYFDGKMVVFRGREFVQSIVQGLAFVLASVLLNLIGNYIWDVVQNKDVEQVSGLMIFLHYIPVSFIHYLPLTIMTIILWGVGNQFFMKFQYKVSLPVTVGLQNPHSTGSSNSQGIGPSNTEGPGPSNPQVSGCPDLGILDNDLRLFFYHLKKDYSLPAPEMLATSSIESIAWAEASPGKMALTVHVKGAVTEVELVYKPVVTLPSGSRVLYRRFKIGPETGMLELEDLRKLVLESMSKARILDPGCTLQFGSFAVLKYTDAGLKWWRLEEHWTPSIYDIRQSPRNLFDSLCGYSTKWIIRGGNLQIAKLKATTEDEVENLKILGHYKVGSGEDELLCEEPQIVRHAALMFRKKVYICASNSVELQDGVVVNLQSEPIKFTRAYWIFVLQTLIPSRWAIIMIFSLSLLEALSHVFHEKHHSLPKFAWGYLDLQHKENIIAGTNLEANAILSRTWNELYKFFLVYMFVIVIPISVSTSWQFLCDQISLAGYDLRRLTRTTTLEETSTFLSPIFENNLLETTSSSSSLATQNIEKTQLEDTSTGSPTLPTSSTTPPPVDNSIHPHFQEEGSTDLLHDILSPSSFQKDFRKESPTKDGAASYDQPDAGSSGNDFSANELFPDRAKADFDEKNQDSDAKVQDCEHVSYVLPPPPPPPQPPLSPEWKEAIDFETGHRYYYNPETNQSSWERPKMGIVIAVQHKKPETSSTGPPSNTAASDFQKRAGCESLEKGKNIVEHDSSTECTTLSDTEGTLSDTDMRKKLEALLLVESLAEAQIQRADAAEVSIAVVQSQGVPKRFSYDELFMATGGFSEKLGEGGFGTVYRGVLPGGIPVAVKRMNTVVSIHGQGMKEFKNEVSVMSQLQHQNLIELRGWCEDPAIKEYMLVYDLMPNGSLDKLLFHRVKNTDPVEVGGTEGRTEGREAKGEGRPVKGKSCLSWPQRFKILSTVADALDYLHQGGLDFVGQGWKHQVIHGDVKCSNILLDNEWNAKLTDFGLSRLVDHDGEAYTVHVGGTKGYIAPEVFTEGKYTDKSDVFAFGVVLLEVVCGRRNWQGHARKKSLVEWVKECLSKGNVISAVDKELRECDRQQVEEMETVLMIGVACSDIDHWKRPKMTLVVKMLAGERQAELRKMMMSFLKDKGHRYYYNPETGIVIADQHKKPETSSPATPSNTAASDFQEPAGCESLKKGMNIVEHGDGARVRQTTSLSEDFGDILAGNLTDSSLQDAGGMSRVWHLVTEGEETFNFKHSSSLARSFMGPMELPIKLVNVNRSDKKTLRVPLGTPLPKLVGRAFQKQSLMVQLGGIPVKFSYEQLSEATGGFSKQSLISYEGFGDTYLGLLASGIRVAVMRLHYEGYHRIWQPGVPLQGQLKHRNVVELLGWCDGGSPKLKESPCYVYEFMPNGSLKNYLFNPVEGKAPSWSQRLKILNDTAAGLDYLHSGWKYNNQVIHRDVKCANIMLDEEYNAKLGEFDIAHVVPHGVEQEEPELAGTLGYMDPQYVTGCKLSSKVDVYSFGVVVLEVVCAQPPLDYNRDPVSIVEWLWQRLKKGDLMEAVDRRLEDYNTDWVKVVLRIGLLCSLTNSEARPSMRQVVRMLARDIPVPPLPPSKDWDSLYPYAHANTVE